MSEPALEIESLSFSVRGAPILRNISARIGHGETWSIIGANGAGKSSLLKCLMRIHSGWSGRVQLFGRPLESYSQRQLAQRVAYVPQPGGDQRFPYTVREFVRMGRYPYAGPLGAAHPGDKAAVDEAIARADVGRFAARTFDTLSGGERQKVFIAAALAQQGDILLLDEPTAFLDYRHQAEVFAILRAINRDTRTTIVAVTHDVNAALLAGGHVLALRKGEVAWSGPTRDLACEKRLGRIFDARFRFLDDPESGLRLVAPQGAAQ
ncbi:MAG: ABC transporter ATP-binding protein [Candidatus Hydrogenedentes bacterium]|nr:ABC transporter ATP-binding protein [Candidatus Hydrogenedentota bacterium]